jgi:hypothetical protein
MASVKHNTETIVNFDPQSNCQTGVSAVLTYQYDTILAYWTIVYAEGQCIFLAGTIWLAIQ